jgi:hypothetical protein
MEWPVSEDNQWRQLGSLVNAVLLDARSKAVRAGTVSKPAPRPFARRIVQPATLAANGFGNGFLAKQAPAPSAPVQLELPFGIVAASETASSQARAPRGARLM